MKTLYVCGSFKFVHEIGNLESKLKGAKIEYELSKKIDSRGLLGCLEKIDKADVVYVVNPEGYIGRSVSVDIGYAFARNKPIYVMHPISDQPVMSLIKDVLSFEELINFIKHSDTEK
jgi:hypothetical protein